MPHAEAEEEFIKIHSLHCLRGTIQ